MESQRQPHERCRKHRVPTEQRSGAGQTTTTEVEEHVPEALHSLCGCICSEPSCGRARTIKGIWRSGLA
jgi:hypothetical protein